MFRTHRTRRSGPSVYRPSSRVYYHRRAPAPSPIPRAVAASVTATIRLYGGTFAYGKQGRSSNTGVLRLSMSRVGRVTRQVTAPIKIKATATGRRSYYVYAPIKIKALRSGKHATEFEPTIGLRLHAPDPVVTRWTVVSVPADPLILFAAAIPERIFRAVSAIKPKASLVVDYQVSMVARIPQQFGPPILLEVDPIEWSGLSWTDELNVAQSCSIGCAISSLTSPVVDRLQDLANNPSELWVTRNGRRVFAGPILGGQVQGETLTINAAGLLAYLKFMAVGDRVFNKSDQTAIGAWLVDWWQSLEYGHFGIDTSAVVPSGVLRDRTYILKELADAYKRVTELGAVINGFDVSVDPATRRLQLDSPFKGTDRSTGEQQIVFDKSNITSPNIVFSSAPGDVGTVGMGTGTASDKDPIFRQRLNEELLRRFGRAVIFGQFDGVSEPATLDAALDAALAPRGEAMLVPGPDVRVTTDADVSSYGSGDLVSYQLHERLSAPGAFRLRKRTITAAKEGIEGVSCEFV